MGWSITVTPPEGMPDVDEPISGMSSCSGNIYSSLIDLSGKRLKELTRDEAIQSLKDMIAECDKEGEGFFTDDYAVKSDIQWSEGRETRKDWDEVYSKHPYYNSYEHYCGSQLRDRLRRTAVRFLLYYVAGYTITYEW
jgi:hypothetical protein